MYNSNLTANIKLVLNHKAHVGYTPNSSSSVLLFCEDIRGRDTSYQVSCLHLALGQAKKKTQIWSLFLSAQYQFHLKDKKKRIYKNIGTLLRSQLNEMSKKKEYNNMVSLTAWKMSVFRVFLARIFQHFWLNTERYSVSPLIQSECWKIRTKKFQNMDTCHAVRIIIIMITNQFKYYSP